MKNWIKEFLAALSQAIYFRVWVWRADRIAKRNLKIAKAENEKAALHVANCTVVTCWQCNKIK